MPSLAPLALPPLRLLTPMRAVGPHPALRPSAATVAAAMSKPVAVASGSDMQQVASPAFYAHPRPSLTFSDLL